MEHCFVWTALEALEIPASIRIIGDSTCYGCRQLHRLEFAYGSKLEVIDDDAFIDTALEQVKLPPGVWVSESAFKLPHGAA